MKCVSFRSSFSRSKIIQYSVMLYLSMYLYHERQRVGQSPGRKGIIGPSQSRSKWQICSGCTKVFLDKMVGRDIGHLIEGKEEKKTGDHDARAQIVRSKGMAGIKLVRVWLGVLPLRGLHKCHQYPSYSVHEVGKLLEYLPTYHHSTV